MKKYKASFLVALVLVASSLSFSGLLILNTKTASAATQAQCTATGGSWVYVGGGSQLGCACPSGTTLINGTGCRTPAQICTDSGGTWGYTGSQLSCTCPSGTILSNTFGCRTPAQLCTDSGGSWGYAGGGSQLACTCPSGESLQASRCEPTPPPPTTGGGGTDQPTDGDPLSQATCEAGVGEELNSSNCGIIKIVVVGINFLSALAGMAIVFSIMFAGYQYMTARDNPGQTQKAKQRIVWALISLLVFIFMYAILNFLVPGGVI